MLLDPMSNLSTRPGRSLFQLLQEGVQTLFHLMLFSLLVLGFGGLVYKALRPEGWLSHTVSQIWTQHPIMAMVICAAGLGTGLWGTRFFERLPLFGKRGDMLVYACLALGLFFAFKLLVTGSL
jgi:hypothetical protein